MLFNSIEFIIFFLPATLFLFSFTAKKYGNEHSILVLVLASLFFYGWWNPIYLLLLLFSMCFNFFIGRRLGSAPKKALLIFGISLNLGLIAYYKYAAFIVFNINEMFESQYQIEAIILPLAISFFTFQQIAYLVDSYQGITKEYNFLHYSLFVAFFPQLIAGPIVHHKEMLPQFNRRSHYRLKESDMVVGLSIFSIGLFKKTVLADGISVYATPVFNSADAGEKLELFEAWGGALAYTFQLYFDFSGYSDMAIGIARMFGIVLPLNFYSPYKATNISEFWTRWHMTLSRFLRDYVYIPLGGNRKGQFKRYRNLTATMLLGGLWHGAGWNFVIWGGLHGFYLVINHGWQTLCGKLSINMSSKLWFKPIAWGITFFAVVVSWVFFRATTLDGAVSMLESMVGLHGAALPNAIYVRLGDISSVLSTIGIGSKIGGGVVFVSTWCWIILLAAVALIMPNTQDLFQKVECSLSKLHMEKHNTYWPLYSFASKLSWTPSLIWAFCTSLMLVFGLLTLSQVSEFLYFQFQALIVSKYLSYIALFSLAIALAVMAINYTINPFGLFEYSDSEKWSLKKTQASDRGRTLKAYAPLNSNIDTLIIGNSRAELGLNPNHPLLSNNKVYNLGLPGADINMQTLYAYNAIESNPVRQVIMGVDFVDFIFTDTKKFRHSPESYDFRLKHLPYDLDRLYIWEKFKDYAAVLFSLDALEASVITLISQGQGLSFMKENGSRSDDEFYSIVDHEGLGILFKQKEKTLRDKFSMPEWKLTEPENNTSHYFSSFSTFISYLMAKDIKIYLYISPYHSIYLDILESTGKYSAFKRWKGLLAAHLQEIGFYQYGGKMWDFSLPSDYIEEPVPPRDSRGQYMEWYWEPAHFRSTLGDKVINTLIRNKDLWGKPLDPL